MMAAIEDLFLPLTEMTRDTVMCDLHIHTNATDGDCSIDEIIAYAGDIGLRAIAFTEHVRKDSDWFMKFADDVRNAGSRTGLAVYVGAEARVVDRGGNLDITDAIRRECDVVLGSVHRFPDNLGGVINFSDVSVETFAQIEYELALGFIKGGQGNVLAHPGGMSIKCGYGFPEIFLRELMKEARSAGLPFEFNSAYITDIKRFCSLAIEEGPLISIGSDVHKLSDLGCCGKSLELSLIHI